MKNRFLFWIAVTLTLIALIPPDLAAAESAASMERIHGSKLEGTNWIVEAIDGKDVLEDVRPDIKFDDGERASGSTGCNRFSGTFKEEKNQLHFGPLITTRRACPEAVMHQEQIFLKALEAVSSFAFDEEGFLHFNDAKGEELIRLIPLSFYEKKESEN